MLAVDNFQGVNAGIFVLRVAVGIVMIAHGYNHIWGGGKIEGTAGWFESLGMKPGIIHAWLASVTELAAGGMLILGFLQPLAAAGVIGVMAVAFVTNHRKNGFFIFRPGEGYEYVLTLMLAGFALGWHRRRRVVDRRLDQLHVALRLEGPTGRGDPAVGGAAALLAVYWKPEPKPAA